MPAVDSNAVFRNLPAMRQASLLEQSSERVPLSPVTVLGTIGDAFMQENAAINLGALIGSSLLGPPKERSVDGYNPFVQDADITLANADDVGEFSRSTSPEETRRIASELEIERARRTRLAQAGAWGIVASMAAGLISPENLIPLSIIAKPLAIGKGLQGASRARQALTLARNGAGRTAFNASFAGLVTETGAQAVLGAQQRTLTTQEQLFAVLASTILSGTLGGIGGALGETRRGMQELVAKEIEEGLNSPRIRGLVHGEDFMKLPGDEQRVKLLALLAEHNPEVARIMQDPRTFLGRFWRKGFRWNPQLRLGTSQAQTYRIVVKRLTDNPMLRSDDVKLGDDVGSSVEAAIVVTYARTADTILRIRDLYVASAARGMNLKELEFGAEITRAMRRGDKARDAIIDPGSRTAIEQGAKIAREMFDRIADDAEAIGLLTKRDLKGTAKSYITRVWDREAVIAHKDELRDILIAHFSSSKNLSRAKIEELADESIDSILKSQTGAAYIPIDIVGEAGPFRERLILIDDVDIEKFLENDIGEILNRFVNEVAPQVELAKAFRVASSQLDLLPKRLNAAIIRAENTGDIQELVDIIEDTASLRAAAALAGGLTEEGLAKQARILDLLDNLPELRRAHRDAVQRHKGVRARVDMHTEARTRREAIEAEVQGRAYDDTRRTVREPWLDELGERRAATERAQVKRAEDLVRDAEALERKTKTESAAAGKAVQPEADALRELRRRGNQEIPREVRETFEDELDDFVERGQEALGDFEADPQDAWNSVVDAALGRGEAVEGFEATIDQLRTALDRGRLRTLRSRAQGTKAVAASEARVRQKAAQEAARDARTHLKETEKDLAKKARELDKDPVSRQQFFQVFRRWVLDQAETVYPRTRLALARNSRAPRDGKAWRELRDEYLSTLRRERSLRSSLGSNRAQAATLSRTMGTTGAALENADELLKGLRREAQQVDKGVAIDTKPKGETVSEVSNTAINAVGDARQRDAMRAVRLDNIMAKANRDYRLLDRDAKTPRERQRLEAERINEQKDLEAIRDRLLNRAGLERGDPHHFVYTAERSLRRLNYVRFMGGVMLSSIPDVAMSVIVNGMGPTIRAWRSALRTPLRELADQLSFRPTKAFQELGEKEELVRLAVALELMSNTRAKAYGDIGDVIGSAGGVEKLIDRGTDIFSRATLINRWNAYQKGIATFAILNRVIDDIGKLVTTGNLSNSARKNLAAGGINGAMARRIYKQFKKWGQVDGGQNFPRTQKWDDLEAKKIMQDAVTADVRRTIITPSAGDLPRWMSMPGWRLLGQFKSFAMSATTKILMSGLQRFDASVAIGAVFSVMMGSTAWALKQMIRGKDPFAEPEGVWIQNAIDRSGLFGILMDINGTIERITHGRVGLSSITQSGTSTRFQVRSAVDALAGPSLGTLFDTVSGVQSLFAEGSFTQADTRNFRKLLPFQNVFYLRFLFDKMEGRTNAVFDIAKTRKEAGRGR